MSGFQKRMGPPPRPGLGQLPRTAPGGAATRGVGTMANGTVQGSVTALQPMVPIRIATGRVLDGDWTGIELTTARAIGSNFGGPHFILQMGYMHTVGDAASFRPQFAVSLPCKETELADATAIEDAERSAKALMHMLNLRRSS